MSDADSLNGAPSSGMRKRRYTVDCSDTRYHVVRAAAVSSCWAVLDRTAAASAPASFHGVNLSAETIFARDEGEAGRVRPQVVWVDRSVLAARVGRMPWYERLNHFPGMNVIARKATLFRRLMRVRRACLPSRASASAAATETEGDSLRGCLLRTLDCFYPRSFSSQSDLGALSQFASSCSGDGVFFIIKPNKGCQGRGIRVTRSPQEALTPEETTAKDAECLIQEYVDRPLLIDDKKFDLRLYVLLTSVTAPKPRGDGENDGDCSSLPAELRGIRLFVHEEGLVRLCASPYESPTDDNCTDRSAHLTNYAVNKTSADYEMAGEGEADVGNKRSLDFMRRFVNSLPTCGDEGRERDASSGSCSPSSSRWERVKRRIAECIVLTVLSGAATLRRELEGTGATRGQRADARNSFELLGFDVMLCGDTLEPVLMEVNHSPSLFCETRFDFDVKRRVLADTFALVASYTPTHAQIVRTKPAELPWPSPAAPEEALIRQGAVAFTQLLPHYVSAVVGGDRPAADVVDWTVEERQRQVAMLQLGAALP